ncbi:unnamed protein product [Caretta caretta]
MGESFQSWRSKRWLMKVSEWQGIKWVIDEETEFSQDENRGGSERKKQPNLISMGKKNKKAGGMVINDQVAGERSEKMDGTGFTASEGVRMRRRDGLKQPEEEPNTITAKLGLGEEKRAATHAGWRERLDVAEYEEAEGARGEEATDQCKLCSSEMDQSRLIFHKGDSSNVPVSTFTFTTFPSECVESSEEFRVKEIIPQQSAKPLVDKRK